jgi:hypothetical protein
MLSALRWRVMANIDELHQERWQGSLSGIPDNFEVDAEVAVGDAVPHPAHVSPWDAGGVCVSKGAVAIHHPGGRLTNDDQVHYDGMLGPQVGQKLVAMTG